MATFTGALAWAAAGARTGPRPPTGARRAAETWLAEATWTALASPRVRSAWRGRTPAATKQTAISVHHRERMTSSIDTTRIAKGHRILRDPSCVLHDRVAARGRKPARPWAARDGSPAAVSGGMHHRTERHDAWDEEPTSPFEQLHAARVLLAEDDPAFRAMMAARLRQDGCDVVEARSGDEALEMIATIADGQATLESLDLVIIDVRMPGMSGLEVIHLLRSWKWTTPVLFVTAYPDPELAAEIGELDGRLLAKPFGLSRLSNAALEALRGRMS